MLKLAALAYLPAAATLFGVLLAVGLIFGRMDDFALSATLYYGAAVLSLVLAAPVAWLVARRMLTRREKRLLDAHAGVGR